MTQTFVILGGSFDPFHNGHWRMAETAQAQLAADVALFVPTAQSPFKPRGPQASFADRVAMIQAAIAEQPGWRVSELEGRRGGVSYTIDTLRALRAEFPDAAFHLVVGADALADFHRWKDYEEILTMAELAVIERPGRPAVAPRVAARQLTMAPMNVSSTDIRQRVRRGEAIDDLVPAAVARYIAEHRLYRA